MASEEQKDYIYRRIRENTKTTNKNDKRIEKLQHSIRVLTAEIDILYQTNIKLSEQSSTFSRWLTNPNGLSIESLENPTLPNLSN